MIEFRHLRTLTALAETGSLGRAAARLHLTQSAISHQLKELEARLSVALVSRDTRPLRLTPAGARLLALAERILPEVEATVAEIRRHARGDTGRLHLAVDCHSCFEWLRPVLDAYRAKWPGVELDITLAHHFAPLPALKRGDLDLVITSDPEPHARLAYTPLFRYESVLLLARDHPLAKQRRVLPRDLRAETLITYPVARERLDVYRGFLDPAGIEPAARRTAELTDVIAQLVASRRGVAALPSWAAHGYLTRGDLVTRVLGARGVWGTLYGAVRSASASLAYVQAFFDTARSVSFRHLKGIRRVNGAESA